MKTNIYVCEADITAINDKTLLKEYNEKGIGYFWYSKEDAKFNFKRYISKDIFMLKSSPILAILYNEVIKQLEQPKIHIIEADFNKK